LLIGGLKVRISRRRIVFVGNALAHLLVAYIALIAPWLSRFKYRQLEHRLAAGEVHSRVRFYKIASLQQAGRILVVGTVSVLGSIPRRSLGLAAPASWHDSVRVLSILLVALAVSIVFFRFRGDWQLRRLVKMVGALLPVSSAERYWFAVVGLGAGISEEIVFRGFLLFYLSSFTTLSPTEMIIVSSLLFGFCHIYQGWFGFLGTTLGGFCLAFLYVGTGSLLVPIVVHAALDLRLLFILTPKRLDALQEVDKATLASGVTG
jgi:CAAX protease family protein